MFSHSGNAGFDAEARELSGAFFRFS